jgi:DNA-binding Lrp family transcriptional regulator
MCGRVTDYCIVDKIDRQIVNLLKQDGRMSNADLAKAVGLSASACLRRLGNLETDGTIRGYTAIVDEPGPDDEIVAIVQITLDRQTEECMKRFETAVRKCTDVRECYLMTGQTDYLLRVSARSVADYERIHTGILSRLPSVVRIQSSFSIRNVIRAAR